MRKSAAPLRTVHTYEETNSLPERASVPHETMDYHDQPLFRKDGRGARAHTRAAAETRARGQALLRRRQLTYVSTTWLSLSH